MDTVIRTDIVRFPYVPSPAEVRYLAIGLCGDGFYLEAAAAIAANLERKPEAEVCDRTALMTMVARRARDAGATAHLEEILRRYGRDVIDASLFP